MGILKGYRVQERRVRKSIFAFRDFFNLDKYPSMMHPSILENIITASELPEPQGFAGRIGAKIYNTLHSDELRKLDLLYTVFQVNTQFRSNHRPDNCFYDQYGQLILG